jgi:flagellar biosynthesis regulator FlbT
MQHQAKAHPNASATFCTQLAHVLKATKAQLVTSNAEEVSRILAAGMAFALTMVSAIVTMEEQKISDGAAETAQFHAMEDPQLYVHCTALAIQRESAPARLDSGGLIAA